MSYLKKVGRYGGSVGLGALLAVGLAGCQQRSDEGATASSVQRAQPAFVVIEEVAKGRYKIAEEFPAKETRIVLKKLDGTEKVMTKEELDYLIKKEAAKIEDGTSNLVKPEGAQVASQGGMGIGEAILASAAGAVLGSWIGSKLFGNPNYQSARKATYKNPSTYSRSVNSFGKKGASSTSSSKRGGFYRSSGSGGRSSARSGFYGG